MSVALQTFKGASWLALFKVISQAISWVITILIARVLVPDDYGLFAMATLITSYAEMFSALGLGAAIIQKPAMKQRELSSVFWFSFTISCLFALSCFPISHITAQVFHNPRVIPYTQSIAIIFILSGLQIVPQALLRKELNFKKIGSMETVSTIVSSLSMLYIAYMGGGIWTLISGRIIRALTMLILTVSAVRWFPQFHFNFREAKSYLKFGTTVAVGASLFYISEISDKFFAGRAWNAMMLGYYAFALQLAQIPTEKIVVLINQVSFPAFSKLQHDKEQFNKLYLDIIKVTGTIVIPLFVGGYMVGEDLVRVLLNEKWAPIIFLFKYLCLSQIITALNVFNNFVQDAKGRPHWSLYFNLASAVVMPLSFYFAVQYGLNAILIPWFTTYFFICAAWVVITLRSMGISLSAYAEKLARPVAGTVLMSVGILVFKHLAARALPGEADHSFAYLISTIGIGAVIYVSYLWIFDRNLFYSLQKVRKS